MDAISRIDTLLSATQSQPDQCALPAGDPVAPYLYAIDKMVTATNDANKASAQAALKITAKREEFERKVAYLSGQVHNAESALAALGGTPAPVSKTSGFQELLDSKSEEVFFWKARLQQLCTPDDLSGIL